MGDFRTYDYAGGNRAVSRQWTSLTAEAVGNPWSVLQKVMNRINEVDHVNEVFYDLTSKPPGAVEV